MAGYHRHNGSRLPPLTVPGLSESLSPTAAATATTPLAAVPGTHLDTTPHLVTSARSPLPDAKAVPAAVPAASRRYNRDGSMAENLLFSSAQEAAAAAAAEEHIALATAAAALYGAGGNSGDGGGGGGARLTPSARTSGGVDGKRPSLLGQSSSILTGQTDDSVEDTKLGHNVPWHRPSSSRVDIAPPHSPEDSFLRFDRVDVWHDVSYLQRLHQHAVKLFEQERCGGDVKSRLCRGIVMWCLPVRFADRAVEEQFQQWSTEVRRSVEGTAVLMLLVLILLFVGVNYVRAPYKSLALIVGMVFVLATWVVVYVLIAYPRRMPPFVQKIRLDVAALVTTIMCLSVVLITTACTSWLRTYQCDQMERGNVSGVLLVTLITLELALGVGFSVHVATLWIVNMAFLGVSLWALSKFPFTVGDFLTLTFAVIMLTALIGAQTYASHVSRRFEFHMLRHMSAQVQTIKDNARALSDAHEAALAERSNAVKAITERETHKAIMGYTCHELRNPLHGLKGCLEELLFRAKKGHVVDDMEAACSQMSQVTDDVLDFNKLQSGRLTLRTEAVDLRTIINRVAVQYNRGHEPRVQVDVAADVPELVRADGLRVTQVLTNGITNALKHMKDGTQVQVLCFMSNGKYMAPMVTVEVWNEGDGLGGVDPARLFEPYERGADEGTVTKGTGLGLPICRLLMTMLGGEVGLEDRGHHTVFWFRLPLRSRSVQAAVSSLIAGADPTKPIKLSKPKRSAPGLAALPAAPTTGTVSDTSISTDGAAAYAPGSVVSQDRSGTSISMSVGNASGTPVVIGGSGGGGSTPAAISSESPWAFWGVPQSRPATQLTILVVDDQLVNRRLLVAMLRRLGHSGQELSDGDQIFNHLQSGANPDICFMDIHMVRSDGRDVVRQLREANIALPLIATTGDLSASEVQTYRDAGFDGVLGKPFSAAHVAALIDAACRSSIQPDVSDDVDDAEHIV